MFEAKERDIETNLGVWLDKLINQKIFVNKDYNIGIERFLRIIPDLEPDIPKIAKLFSKFFIIPLLEKKIIDTKLLVWPEPNDDMYSVDVYFKVAAEIFKYQNKTQSWTEIESKFI